MSWPYPGVEEWAVSLEIPKATRKRAQRALGREQEAICAGLDAHRDPDGRGYSGQEWARYRDSRGWRGWQRYVQATLASRRRYRRAAPHRPWSTLLKDWTPDKRCHHALAVDAQGRTVHHDDPAAARWCLAGWLAHRCMREQAWRAPHTVNRDKPWWTLSDDREAKRLLDEIWALVPERQRQVVERAWRQRIPSAATRKRVDQHPLGYWWFIAPHLAERFLGLEPSAELAPETVRGG